MQDLKALEGKSLAELREIGAGGGSARRGGGGGDLIENIQIYTQDVCAADTAPQQSPAEAPKKTRRPRIA